MSLAEPTSKSKTSDARCHSANGRRNGARHPPSIARAIMSRSPEALAFGARRHFMPTSLSLPFCGCLLNRSRDCSRSRVPPRFPRRRYADAPAAASFPGLRFAQARSHRSAGLTTFPALRVWKHQLANHRTPLRDVAF